MLTTTLQDRLRRASALTGLEPAEMGALRHQRVAATPRTAAAAVCLGRAARAAQGGTGAGSGSGRRAAQETRTPTSIR